MGSSTFVLFLYSALLFFATLTLSQKHSDDVYYEYICDETRGNYTANSLYKANLNRLVSQFSSLKKFNYGFYNLSVGKRPNDVHSIALCRGDRNLNQCKTCLNYTATELKRFCPSNKEAIAWSEFCLVRYANRDLYGQLEPVPPRTCVYNTRFASDPDRFNKALSDLLYNLSNDAAAGGPLRKYAAGNASVANFERVFAMVQCTPDMDQFNCSKCLTFAMQELDKCCAGRIGCRILRTTCVLRFESDPFISQNPVPLPSPPPPRRAPPTPRGGKKSPPSDKYDDRA